MPFGLGLKSEGSPLSDERLLMEAGRLIDGFQLTGGAATDI
jgi:hypothetical protein